MKKVSIITVVFNGEDTIERTIKSVLKQTYPEIEYIIIDGQSTDQTMQIVKQYQKQISQIVSEPDQGIYDAMNKGLDLASGDVIYFLNADDFLIDQQAVEKVVDLFEERQVQVVSSDIKIADQTNELLYISKRDYTQANFRQGKKIVHQALFVDNQAFEQVGNFNTDFSLAADFDLECRLTKANCAGTHLSQTLCQFNADGASSNLAHSYYQTCLIIEKYFGAFPSLSYAIKKSFVFIGLSLVTKIFSDRQVLRLTKWIKS